MDQKSIAPKPPVLQRTRLSFILLLALRQKCSQAQHSFAGATTTAMSKHPVRGQRADQGLLRRSRSERQQLVLTQLALKKLLWQVHMKRLGFGGCPLDPWIPNPAITVEVRDSTPLGFLTLTLQMLYFKCLVGSKIQLDNPRRHTGFKVSSFRFYLMTASWFLTRVVFKNLFPRRGSGEVQGFYLEYYERKPRRSGQTLSLSKRRKHLRHQMRCSVSL